MPAPTDDALAIGIDSFSYHRYFGEHTPWETPLTIRWTTRDFLERAAQLGVGSVSLQTVYLPPLTISGAEPLIEQLREALQALKLQPVLAWGHRSGLEGGSNPAKAAELYRWVEVAHTLGCTLMRIVCGDATWFSVPADERMARLLPIIRQCGLLAANHAMTIAIENHADFRMRDLIRLVQAADAQNVGILYDCGNALRVGDDPLQAATDAAPFVRMVHIKDMVPQPASIGNPNAWWPGAPLGRGKLDIMDITARLRAGGYRGGLFVEMPNMHPNWPDEDAAVADSIGFLRAHLHI